MEKELKGVLKKSMVFGFLVSLILLVLNSIIRPAFFPQVEFENALLYYVFYMILIILIFLLVGWFYYIIIKRSRFAKSITYTILGILILISMLVALVLLYILNFIISFSRPF